MLEISAHKRKEKPQKIRRAGKIPAILYGHKVENAELEVDYKEFEKIYKEVGESMIVQLKFDNQVRNVLIHDVQKDPLTSKFVHVDFYQIKMDEKISVSVQLVFIGESAAIKDAGGILVRNLQEIEVEAFPQDLPREIEVNISSINTFEDHIYIKDLLLSDKVKILAGADEIVASVVPPRTEEELATLEEKPEEVVEKVEVVAKKEKEAEEVVEGETKKKSEEKSAS